MPPELDYYEAEQQQRETERRAARDRGDFDDAVKDIAINGISDERAARLGAICPRVGKTLQGAVEEIITARIEHCDQLRDGGFGDIADEMDPRRIASESKSTAAAASSALETPEVRGALERLADALVPGARSEQNRMGALIEGRYGRLVEEFARGNVTDPTILDRELDRTGKSRAQFREDAETFKREHMHRDHSSDRLPTDISTR